MSGKDKAGISSIGLFDSGVGGLSILRALKEAAALLDIDTSLLYFADSGRCPYGERSAAEIRTFVEEIVAWYNEFSVDRLIMACNTSAAVARDIADTTSKAGVFDLISSASRFASLRFARVAVLATTATCRSGAFARSLKGFNPSVQVCEIACPDLVPLVEKGLLNGELVQDTIAKYSKKVLEFEADSLIFGCTHFPFLEDAFRLQLPADVALIDPAEHLINDLFDTELSRLKQTRFSQWSFEKDKFVCTGNPKSFAASAELCLRLPEGSLNDSVIYVDAANLRTENPLAVGSASRRSAATGTGN